MRIHLAIVTDREKGASPHAGIPAGPELPRLRAEEARCSCHELGIDTPSDPPWGYLAQVAQAGAEGAPSRLLYRGLPADRLRHRRELADPPWAATDPRFLTVRVPYDDADLAATRKALACHKSQFPAEQMEALVSWLHEVLAGRVYLRPWFGARATDDLFKLELP